MNETSASVDQRTVLPIATRAPTHPHDSPEPVITDADGPIISVIVPIADHRGWALRSVETWARDQSLPRHRYEVLVVSGGREPALEAQIAALLAPRDRLIVEPSGDEARLYDVGARQARGRWLLFTEGHCLADRDCLSEMVRHLTETRSVGAMCGSENICETPLARMEARMSDALKPANLDPSFWAKFFLRGTAVSRDVYLQLGGLAWRYGRFCEVDFALRLHLAGYRLGYVPSAVVHHATMNAVSEIRETLHEYAQGEIAYRHEHPLGEGNAYFGEPGWWRDRGLLDPAVERYLQISVLKCLTASPANRSDLQRSTLQLLPTTLLGTRAHLWRADWKVLQARLRCWWWRNRIDRADSAFSDLWSGLVEQGALAVLVDRESADLERCATGVDFSMVDVPGEWLTGFHALEEHDGERFRWSAPIACIKLPLESRDGVLRLRTRGLRPGVRLRAFLNGHQLAVHDCQTEHGEIRLMLRGRHVRPTPFQYLVLVCEPLRPWLHGVEDRRELGLPMFRVVQSAHDAT